MKKISVKSRYDIEKLAILLPDQDNAREKTVVEAQTTIVNKLGLHARSASKLVSVSNTFTAQCEVIYKNRTVSTKSIMELLMLAAKQGEQLTIRCNGRDETQALEKILELITNRFGEDE